MKKKIAFVVQRYGLEVNGGSELSCRLIAEKLSRIYDVEILTTKALDYTTWENHYQADVEQIHNLTVRRFKTDFPREMKKFNKVNEQVFTKADRNVYDELEWMKAQGPVSFDLINYIKSNHHQYEKVIFFTYLYFTTFWGLQQIPEKSILVPTAHDEPYIYFSIFKPFFHLPQSIIFLTEEEKDFVLKTFHNEHLHSVVAGVGVDVPDKEIDIQDFKDKFNINEDYILYVGRIDESKGCKELFDYYLRYKKTVSKPPKLVLIGKSVIDIPNDPDIIPLGFVTDEEKFAAMKNAEILMMPSKFESLSMVVLESLYYETPVIVNGHCDVLVGHCERGNAGLYYTDYSEFVYCLNMMLENDNLRKKMGLSGKEYVMKHFDWEIILGKFIECVNR
ncbi:glycosyltransferase family 4 protein [Paenibacillus sp. 453mf]|uniref:glycosyltransferase family 4 protein n=1 Tax=Paenibacillus sp. 453mf TaxID=1761874 RepID=UPI0008F43FE9|nr:glycosyltransferase family 4 protein [Paenibacillus sp. 453mf]SFS84546.1 Glycosyltransferase involved in cell wall bisynthesis [Paenibacillus sp. 453mf]